MINPRARHKRTIVGHTRWERKTRQRPDEAPFVGPPGRRRGDRPVRPRHARRSHRSYRQGSFGSGGNAGSDAPPLLASEGNSSSTNCLVAERAGYVGRLAITLARGWRRRGIVVGRIRFPLTAALSGGHA